MSDNPGMLGQFLTHQKSIDSTKCWVKTFDLAVTLQFSRLRHSQVSVMYDQYQFITEIFFIKLILLYF